MSAILDKAFQKFMAQMERDIKRTSMIPCLPTSRERALMYEAWLARESRDFTDRQELLESLRACPSAEERLSVFCAWFDDDEVTEAMGWKEGKK